MVFSRFRRAADMDILDPPISREGISVVYNANAEVDIILVHGLCGSPSHSWSKNGVFWPHALLSGTLQPSKFPSNPSRASQLPEACIDRPANILVFGYDAEIFDTKKLKATKQTIEQRANDLVEDLLGYRKNARATKRPIIWIVHSLGGIIVKEALNSGAAISSRGHSIYKYTYGIFFFGTPHHGSRGADVAAALVNIKKGSESTLLKILKVHSDYLENNHDRFAEISPDFKICMTYETFKTAGHIIVKKVSAAPALPYVTRHGINETHSGMCKFENVEAPGYIYLTNTVRDWIEHLSKGSSRLEKEPERQYKHRLCALGLAPPQNAPLGDTSSDSPVQLSLELLSETALFLHPIEFRPNENFVGRRHELQDLHKRLMNFKGRETGASAVLIHAGPGTGKTELAHRYVDQYREDYPGGIFWVNAKSTYELVICYQYIDDQFLDRGQNLGSPAGDSIRGGTAPKVLDSDEYGVVVKRVCDFLRSIDRWLIIFDGIIFDLPDIKKFIPYKKNTSIIYTSTDRSAIGNNDFNSPAGIELGCLSLDEAQTLLFKNMGASETKRDEDSKKLVKRLDYLPEMICLAGSEILSSRVSLTRYRREYPRRVGITRLKSYKNAKKELKRRRETEAENLLSLLALFDRNIPVTMLAFGRRALPALDDTISVLKTESNWQKAMAVLIKFGLIERTEMPLETLPGSTNTLLRNALEGSLVGSSHDSSYSSSQDSGMNSSDRPRYKATVCLHRVLKDFLVVDMLENGTFDDWMLKSIHVFRESVQISLERIKDGQRHASGDDYKDYLRHGDRLKGHLENMRGGRQEQEIKIQRHAINECLKEFKLAVNEAADPAHLRHDTNRHPGASLFESAGSWKQERHSGSYGTRSVRSPSPVNTTQYNLRPQNERYDREGVVMDAMPDEARSIPHSKSSWFRRKFGSGSSKKVDTRDKTSKKRSASPLSGQRKARRSGGVHDKRQCPEDESSDGDGDSDEAMAASRRTVSYPFGQDSQEDTRQRFQDFRVNSVPPPEEPIAQAFSPASYRHTYAPAMSRNRSAPSRPDSRSRSPPGSAHNNMHPSRRHSHWPESPMRQDPYRYSSSNAGSTPGHPSVFSAAATPSVSESSPGSPGRRRTTPQPPYGPGTEVHCDDCRSPIRNYSQHIPVTPPQISMFARDNSRNASAVSQLMYDEPDEFEDEVGDIYNADD